jgi:Protein of unknown function (DUF4058)
MPLLDHFRDPDDADRSWSSFEAFWAPAIAADLNRRLRPRFQAQLRIRFGREIEADVAEFERDVDVTGNGPGGGVAVQAYAPPQATMTLPATFPDEVQVRVFDRFRDRRLVAVIELVSPANKDRDDHRDDFAMKCAAYLRRGVGLLVVDVVTVRHFNLHGELVRVMGLAEGRRMSGDPPTYAASYRPVREGDKNRIDVWAYPLTVGEPLPAVPLALMGFGCVPLDLEATYTSARDAGGVG